MTFIILVPRVPQCLTFMDGSLRVRFYALYVAQWCRPWKTETEKLFEVWILSKRQEKQTNNQTQRIKESRNVKKWIPRMKIGWNAHSRCGIQDRALRKLGCTNKEAAHQLLHPSTSFRSAHLQQHQLHLVEKIAQSQNLAKEMRIIKKRGKIVARMKLP